MPTSSTLFFYACFNLPCNILIVVQYPTEKVCQRFLCSLNNYLLNLLVQFVVLYSEFTHKTFIFLFVSFPF